MGALGELPELSVLAQNAASETENLLGGITSRSPIKRAWTSFNSVNGNVGFEEAMRRLKTARHEISFASKNYIDVDGVNPTEGEVQAYHILKAALNRHQDLAVDFC